MTYAQKPYPGVALAGVGPMARYQTHSNRKSLIYKDKLNCLFIRHWDENLDSSGLAGRFRGLSTKLSTENRGHLNGVKNQGFQTPPAPERGVANGLERLL